MSDKVSDKSLSDLITGGKSGSPYANKDNKLAAKSLFQMLMEKMASNPTVTPKGEQMDPQWIPEPKNRTYEGSPMGDASPVTMDLPVRGPMASHGQGMPTSVAFPPQGPPMLGPSAHPLTIGKAKELPFETFQRLTGMKWHGGNDPQVADLLQKFGIEDQAGSASANLALQKALLANAKNVR